MASIPARSWWRNSSVVAAMIGGVFTIVAAGITVIGDGPSGSGGEPSVSVPVPTVVPTATPRQIAALLPDAPEVPSRLTVIEDERRSLEELSKNYSNPEATIHTFRELGWQGNITRTFGPREGLDVPQTDTTSVYVSVHRFGTDDGARRALDYSFHDQASTTESSEIAGPGLGDYSRALVASAEAGTEVTFIVQSGAMLIRLSTYSVSGDPYDDAVDVMNAILRKL